MIDPVYEQLVAETERWRYDPVCFVEECIRPSHGVTYQQTEALNLYRDIIQARERRHESMEEGSEIVLSPRELDLNGKYGLSVQSGQGTGKDAFCSWVILHFLRCFPRPKILCTAPTGTQLKTVLWSEIFKWYYNTPLRQWFVHQSDKFFLKELKGRQHFAIPKTINVRADGDQQAETLAGQHEDYLLFIIDEASGVPDPVFRPIEGAMTGACNFAIVIFNPTKAHGYAYKTQTANRNMWECLQWDARDSELVTKDHIDRMREKYGEKSNMFRIRVMGQPPVQDSDTLIPLDWVMRATVRDREPQEGWKVVAGLDVAGGGADRTVLVWGQGHSLLGIEECEENKAPYIAEWAYKKMQDYGIEDIAVDANGVGSGIADNLEMLVDSRHIHRILMQELPEGDVDRFERLRDEMWWKVRQEFEDGVAAIPPHDDLIAQLTSIKYEAFRGRLSKMKVQAKTELRRKGQPSCDHADAYALYLFIRDRRGKKYDLLRPESRFRPYESWLTV